MTRQNTRLIGHTLRSEGAPFAWTTNGGRYIHTTGLSGVGLCSCGEVSEVEESGAARKRWHRTHKEQIQARSRSGEAL